MAQTIHPLADRVVVTPLKASISSSGIIIPENADSDAPEQGMVTAIGKECKEVQVGDKVVFAKYGPETISLDGTDYYILREDQILAVIK